MPVVRPVTLIAVVALTMGLALDVIGGVHRAHVASVAPESCATDYFWFGANKLGTQLRKGGTRQGLPTAPSDRRYSGSARAIAGVAIRSQDWRSPGNDWIPRQEPR